jgi:hypothetical protein
MKTIRFFLLAISTVAFLLTAAPHARSTPAMAQPTRALVFDVAIDGRTWRYDTGPNPFDPFSVAVLGAVRRGNSFVVQGKVYPGGTIPIGGDFSNPSSFGPDSPGSIGLWICRGVMNFDGSQILAGQAPHAITTQIFALPNGGLWTDGPEGGISVIRAVTGGTDQYSGARGEVRQDPLGVNSAGTSKHFNSRFTFALEKDAPK